MTTIITVETHDWPVSVSTSSSHEYSDANVRSSNWSSTTEFVPAHTNRRFTISASTSVSINELPIVATGLENGNQTASFGAGAVTTTEAATAPGDEVAGDGA